MKEKKRKMKKNVEAAKKETKQMMRKNKDGEEEIKEKREE